MVTTMKKRRSKGTEKIECLVNCGDCETFQDLAERPDGRVSLRDGRVSVESIAGHILYEFARKLRLYWKNYEALMRPIQIEEVKDWVDLGCDAGAVYFLGEELGSYYKWSPLDIEGVQRRRKEIAFAKKMWHDPLEAKS